VLFHSSRVTVSSDYKTACLGINQRVKHLIECVQGTSRYVCEECFPFVPVPWIHAPKETNGFLDQGCDFKLSNLAKAFDSLRRENPS
jgi:hypothetical protein